MLAFDPLPNMLAYAHRVEQPFPQSAGVRTLSCMRAFDQFPKTLAYADRVEQPLPQSVGVRTLSCMRAFDPFQEMLAYADRVGKPFPQSVGVCSTCVTSLQRSHSVCSTRVHSALAYAVLYVNTRYSDVSGLLGVCRTGGLW